jgi:hypothetical protein
MASLPSAKSNSERSARTRLLFWRYGLLAAIPMFAVFGIVGIVVREEFRFRAYMDTYKWLSRMGGTASPIHTPQGTFFTKASFDCTELSDEELAEAVRRMPDLLELHLCGTLLTDGSFQYLGRLKALKKLDMNGTKVTSEALLEFTRLHPNIEFSTKASNANWTSVGMQTAANRGGNFNTAATEFPLSLEGCKLNDDDLQVILTESLNICRLNLRDTDVTNDSMRIVAVTIQPSTWFQVLNLADTEVGDEGLINLAGCDSVQTLILRGTRVTDKGLAVLSGKHLRHLDLRDTLITDAGLLQRFRNGAFTRLQILRLRGTRVTHKGILELHAALPNTLIEE